MNNAARIAEIVLPVVVSLFLGWLSRLKNILSRAQIDGLKTFVVTFSLPAVLFMAFAVRRCSFSASSFAGKTRCWPFWSRALRRA